MIRITLKIKFRIFGITIGTVDESFDWKLGIGLPPAEKVFMQERGIYLAASTH